MTYEELKRTLGLAYMEGKHETGLPNVVMVDEKLLLAMCRIIDEADRISMSDCPDAVELSFEMVEALNALEDFTDDSEEEIIH